MLITSSHKDLTQALDKLELTRLAEIYKLFGNLARLKILLKLSNGEYDASELAKAAGLSQSATSHQLKDLKNCRIVKARKEGARIFYSLDDNHILKLLETGIEHIKGEHCYE